MTISLALFALLPLVGAALTFVVPASQDGI